MKKKLVVIGYGGMGGWHTRAAEKSDVVTLGGIYDIKEERRKAAEDAGIFSYDSFEAVLADPMVDLVTIAVPNDEHERLTVAALEAGKNVINEKPVTLTSQSLKRMIDASERAGKLLTVHQNRRWDVDYLAMQKIVDSGEIREIHFAFVNRIADPEFVEKAGRIGFGDLFLVSHQSVSCSVTASVETGAA